MEPSAMSWGRFEWRAGADRYSYEIEPGGLYATLRTGAQPPLTLPLVAWEGLIDAIRTNKKSRTRQLANLPARAGARWTEAEADEVADAYTAGVSVRELAKRHARTQGAIEHQLVKVGLMERRNGPPIEDRALTHHERDGRSHLAPGPGAPVQRGLQATNEDRQADSGYDLPGLGEQGAPRQTPSRLQYVFDRNT